VISTRCSPGTFGQRSKRRTGRRLAHWRRGGINSISGGGGGNDSVVYLGNRVAEPSLLSDTTANGPCIDFGDGSGISLGGVDHQLLTADDFIL
jgi:hypothetical protein